MTAAARSRAERLTIAARQPSRVQRTHNVALVLAFVATTAWPAAGSPDGRGAQVTPPSARPAPIDPAGDWLEYASPAEAGFDPVKLAAARDRADSLRSGAVMVVFRGHVVAAFGAVDRNFMAHSVRKSLAGALYGIAAAERSLNLEATLADLGVDDVPPLTEGEKRARVRDLLGSRSGVYHGAAYAPREQDENRPTRDSHAPGTHWFYNNWDFNAAETIYERTTGTDLFTAFANRIAAPIGMQDFSARNGFEAYEPSLSRMPAHTFRISARDLARFGQLYLREGEWGGRQVVPREWVRDSLQAHSDLGDGAGYGLLWWTYAPGALGERYPTLNGEALYATLGAGGQLLVVIPAFEMVVVHRGDTDHGRSVRDPDVWSLVEQVVAARSGEVAASPTLRPLEPQPLASQLPEPTPPAGVAPDLQAVQQVAGDYETAEGQVVRVFTDGPRAFVSVPREGEAQLFALPNGGYTVMVAAGVTLSFQAGADGRPGGLTLRLGPRTVEARRADYGVVPQLISSDELYREIDNPDLVLLHVGDKARYDVAHLPGARFVSLDAISRPRGESLRMELPDTAALVSTFEGLGISNRSHVVVYFGEDWATPTARVFFTLDFLGLGDRVSYLDGGMPAWQAAGRAVTADVPEPARGRIAPRINAGALASLTAVDAARRDASTSIVDARDAEFYTGESDARGRYKRPGHIPGARSVPFQSLLQEDGRFKPRSALVSLLREAGVGDEDRVISYCHLGQQASLVYFVARMLGHDVSLYDGSFEEWSAHPEVPVETSAGAGVR